MHFIKSAFNRLLKLLWSKKSYRFLIRDWFHLTDLQSAGQVLATMRQLVTLEPLETEAPAHRRIAVIAPHQDDEIIGPGGTLLLSLASKSTVKVFYLTEGTDPKTLENESANLANEMGFEREFFDFPLGKIPLDKEALKRVASSLNAFKPDLLFLPFLLDDHDDHRRASELVYEMSKESLLNPVEVWAYQVYGAVIPNIAVDITSVKDRKAFFIRFYASQMKKRDWANFSLGLNAWNSRLLPGKSGPQFVEPFFVLPLKEYAKVCQVYFTDAKNSNYYKSYKR